MAFKDERPLNDLIVACLMPIVYCWTYRAYYLEPLHAVMYLVYLVCRVSAPITRLLYSSMLFSCIIYSHHESNGQS